MPMASNVAHSTHGGRVAATWQKDRWEITAGADLRDMAGARMKLSEDPEALVKVNIHRAMKKLRLNLVKESPE